MQHYINYGYGFPSSVLTKKEFERVMEQDFMDAEDGKYSLSCIPFTEGEFEIDWSCIVLYPIGEVKHSAKMITMTEINKINKKHGRISEEQKSKILEVLKTANLERHIDKVELVFYSDNY
jgi:hypothetical protein